MVGGFQAFLYYAVVIVGVSTITWKFISFVEWLDTPRKQKKHRTGIKSGGLRDVF